MSRSGKGSGACKEVCAYIALSWTALKYPHHKRFRLLGCITCPLGRCPAYHIYIPYVFHIYESIPAGIVAEFLHSLEMIRFKASVIGLFFLGLEIILFCFAVKKQRVVFSWEMSFAASARFICPDNFIYKVIVPENLIKQDFGIVGNMPVKMHPQTAVLCEKLFHSYKSWAQHTQILCFPLFPFVRICGNWNILICRRHFHHCFIP